MKKSPEPPHPESGLALREQAMDLADLELPDAPDFVSRRTAMPLPQVLLLIEERRRLFPQHREALRARRRQPVDAEFVL